MQTALRITFRHMDPSAAVEARRDHAEQSDDVSGNARA